MAIYTQYGRYIKAKLFKETLQTNNHVYMAYGIGCPYWDTYKSGSNKDTEQIQMPVAPYNETVKSLLDSSNPNMFYDNNSYQTIAPDNNSEVYALTHDDANSLNPKFPCLWKNDTNVEVLKFIDGTSLMLNDNYKDVYVGSDNVCHKYLNNAIIGSINPNDLTKQQMQFYAELRLRGIAHSVGRKHPLGLIGMTKCDVSLVRDIGSDYTGSIDEFWYGDRYWKIVRPSDDISIDGEYPHHVLISSTINPGALASDLNLERWLSPRQIAIYTLPKTPVTPKAEFRISECIFNVGQYTDEELLSMISANNISPDNIVQLVTPFTAGSNEHYGTLQEFKNVVHNRFSLLLHDYVKGFEKDDHSVERFGYVIGF